MTDFFISYTNADEKWAEWIAWTLEAEGFSVVLQAWDFVPGSNFALEMQKASGTADRTVAVLSPDYLSSRFGVSEWASAFADDPDGLKRKLVPIKVRTCSTEGLFKPLVYIDIVGLDEELARARILNGLRSVRAKPTQRPEFPAKVGSGQLKSGQPDTSLQVPYERNIPEGINDSLYPPHIFVDPREHYQVTFTEECINCLNSMNVSQSLVLDLMWGEFRGHMNYFRFDLEDYIMPLKADYLLYLDKIYDKISLKSIFKCTGNEAKLSRWNDILRLYRRATRLPYRRDPQQIIIQDRTLSFALSLHRETAKRLVKYFEIHEPTINLHLYGRATEGRRHAKEPATTSPVAQQLQFHLDEATGARDDITEIMKESEEKGESLDSSLGPIITSLEYSLQHLHKILLKYLPTT